MRLQPENKDLIYNSIFNRAEYSSQYSLVLIKDWNDPVETYFVNRSLSNRIEHNKKVNDYYLKYPVQYFSWRIPIIFNGNYLLNLLDKLYINTYHILIVFVLMWIYLFSKYKDKRFYLIFPLIFVIGTIFWFLLISNVLPRVVSHLHSYPHSFLQYSTPIFICAILYMVNLVFCSRKNNN
ncbi:hypothetical protein KQ44_11980 [Brachyspira sp. G79]|nr:hypothetical protein KQ44_11980 [Brachyspira sp. G79]